MFVASVYISELVSRVSSDGGYVVIARRAIVVPSSAFPEDRSGRKRISEARLADSDR